MISPIFLFSYWIFAWFILWYVFVLLGKTKEVICWNPLLALALALLENVLSWLWLIWMGADVVVVVQYLFMILLIKAVPLYLVGSAVLPEWSLSSSSWLKDAKVLLGVFAVYCVVVFWHTGASPLVLYEKVMHSILHVRNPSIRNEEKPPLFSFFDWLQQRSKNF